MGRAYRVYFLLALGALDGCLAVAKAVLVPTEGPGLSAINNTDLLVTALAVHCTLLVVFDPAVALRNVSRWYLW